MNNKENVDNQYQSILNNLLDVSPNDSAVFTRINNKYAFDFYTLFGPEAFNFIYRNNHFDIPILEVNLIRIINILEKIDNYEEMMKLLEENNIEISENKANQLKKNFNSTKLKIIEELKVNFQKQSLKWKLFLNKSNEINTETNIWPMHLGFLFVRLQIENKSVYAPLFLKEVYIEIRNGRPFLVSNGDIKNNEKLLFLLNNAGFDLNVNENFGDWSIEQLIKYLKNEWRDLFDFKINLNEPFRRMIPDFIDNESIVFEPGVVLGLFQPSGGYARNRMMEIIENNELNNILDIEFNKNIYKNRVKETIFNPRTSIFKITPTNYSQDKAIASSLNQNTIIWGPPGTGKSQTIVNILTNLLVYKKTSLVCSQKKAALEVIKNRMNSLKMFCLFMLNSKNMNRKSFYLPLKKYLDYLENYDETSNLKPQRIINAKDIKFVNNIKKFADDKRFDIATKLIPLINSNWHNFSQELWDFLLTLPSDLVYPQSLKFKSQKELVNKFLRLNKVYGKFWKVKNITIKKISKSIFNTLNNFDLNIDKIIKLINGYQKEDFIFINDLINILPIYQNNDISDENELKKFIAKNIIDMITKFNDEEKKEYKDFAATIRLASLEPYKFIKRFANMIKKIFPIVIVTPEADLSAWNKEEFDYAILDESSQIFLEKGLPILYLAKIKILAGDDQQMKPSNWFGTRVTDDDSIYGKVESLLDFAKSLGVYNVLLDKNYRSNFASLMTFSSKYFYNKSLDVIDSAWKDNNYQPIEVYEVDGVWENNQNEFEAKLAIKLLQDNIDIYKKIILLCFNSKQQDAITTTIFKNYPELEKKINTGHLLLRNIENIQGDEADLVIVSIAYDKNTAIHSTYVGRPGGMNALNVAISRAKDKMIVIKSLKSQDLTILTNNEDALIFKRWLEFLELNSKDKQNFLTLEDEQNEDKSNNDIKPIEHNELKNLIKNELLKNIENKPFLSLCDNESLGTINVDLVLKRHDEILLTFIIDNYKYANDVENFVKLNDLCKFIRSKNYTLYKLDKFLWESKKQEIFDLINSYKDITQKEIVNEFTEIPISQIENKKNKELELLKTSEYIVNIEDIEDIEIVSDDKLDLNKKQIQLISDEETAEILLDENLYESELLLQTDNQINVNDSMTIEEILDNESNNDDFVAREVVPVKKNFEENTKEWKIILDSK
ncbi:AAA domain-containing protein [Mycoplasmopsis lipofaciens]|uniref:AAA domain-containing protein n=1 Tax=Mycoplasmopsis lipofaciens TaxID=114884 RepID=UPI0004893B50|nr:DEAD/DEAH box helicase [Mycoplasmopsis lipofaciens]